MTWRKRAAIAFEGLLLPWLYCVALGVTRNHHRSRTRYRAALNRVPPVEAHGDHADDVAQKVDAETRTKAVIEELSRLPRKDREVLEMAARGLPGRRHRGRPTGMALERVRHDAHSARLNTADGRNVPVLLHEGWAVSWWPSDARATLVPLYDEAGHVLETFVPENR